MIPVAIMTGDGDKVIDPEQADKPRRAIPHGTLQILHGIAHMIHHLATQEVVDAIEEVARMLPRPEYSGSGHILRFALNAEEGGKASA
jgi:pimeloyl-ACP methyl ester carboxylesterase